MGPIARICGHKIAVVSFFPRFWGCYDCSYMWMRSLQLTTCVARIGAWHSSALFTITFAGNVGLLTGARKGEAYGVTASYAAMLVVFVSGNSPNES